MSTDASVLSRPAEAAPSLSALQDDPDALSDLLISLRRHLHRHPEVGTREYATARFIRETLEAYGLSVEGPVAETGLFVDIEGAAPGPRVGYRADIDALPAADAKDVPYRSTRDGVAHLCGHDAHAAMGIGVALLLHARREKLSGTARVFFQPNEEGMPSGAPRMIQGGVIDGLSAVYAVHVDPTLDTGCYGLKDGPVTAAADRFDVHVCGSGTGHSARPHEVVDTVWVANQVMQALYQLAGRVTDARNATILTICRLQGGEAHNVIPAEASFGGTLRTTSEHDRAFLKEQMHETARHTAALYGATVEIDYEAGAPAVTNDAEAVERVAAAVRALHGEEAVYEIPRPSMGAEDFAHYLKEVPGALVRVGSGSSEATRYPLHDARFDLDESALAPAARLMTRVVAGHLTAA